MTSLFGQTVEWTSQGGGHTTTKRGVVIVDAGMGDSRTPNQLLMFGRYGWRDGIIVRVDRPGKLPLYYAPRRKGLKVVTP